MLHNLRWLVADHGMFYGPVSGWVGDLTLLSIPVVMYRRHICHVPWCLRLGKHPDGVYVKCAKHHPDVPYRQGRVNADTDL